MLSLGVMHGYQLSISKLAPGLSQKLAAKFVGPFWVIAAVGAMSFCLELPS